MSRISCPTARALDEEARERGNSCYFPGYVIPMLPEILSNGVCSLQEDVPRLCKSAFITYDDRRQADRARSSPTRSSTAPSGCAIARRRRSSIDAAQRDRFRIPTAIARVGDYRAASRRTAAADECAGPRLQKRRLAQGQIVLDLPEVELVLDEDGKVIDAVPEDQSFTHTLIEMFMVEANEAVARLLDSQDVPFLRRTHPEPEVHRFGSPAAVRARSPASSCPRCSIARRSRRCWPA